MKNRMFKKEVKMFKSFFAIALFLTLISTPSITSAQRKIIKIDGSSTVYPIIEAFAEEFTIQKKGAINVTVGISGTGGGFKKFCRGEIDISNASRPISQKEIDACVEEGISFIEVPIAYDGLAIVVNPKNDWLKSISVEELKKMWEPSAQGKVKKWKDVNPSWPDVPLKLFGPGVDSGTFDYFTEAVVGKAKSSRGDFTSSEDDNVLVQGISGEKYSLGYFGLAYYEENKDKLKLVPVINPWTKKEVLPSEKTIKDGTYQPFSRPLFIYINKDSLKKKEVKEFVDFCLNNATSLVKEAKYIPLPDEIYKKLLKRVERKKTGSIFKGDAKVGVKIEDLLREEEKK